MENEHLLITSVILNMKSWKFVRSMMINNIKLKLTKLLSFKNIGKGLISIALITSILVSPFTIHADTDTGESNEVGYINCKQFFTGYNMTQVETMGHGLVSNGTGGYNFTNQTVNTPSMWYNVMIMPTGLSFNRYTAYTSTNRTRATKSGSYIVFLSSTNFTDANTKIYTESGYTSQISRITNERLTVSTPLGFYLICFKITAINQHSRGYNWVTIDFPGTTSTQIVPLYMGMQDTMPEEIHRLVFGTSNQYIVYDWAVKNAVNQVYTAINTESGNLQNAIGRLEQQLTQINEQSGNSASYLYDIRTDTGRIINLINSGNSSSQSTSNDLDDVSESLEDQMHNLNDVNQSLENDMSSSLNNLDTNSLLMQSQQFTKGMSWLKARFNTMFNNNPFGWYIQISLIIGIAIFMIGRYRK